MELTGLKKNTKIIIICILVITGGVILALYAKLSIENKTLSPFNIEKTTRVEITANVDGVSVLFNDTADHPRGEFLKVPATLDNIKPGKNIIRARRESYEEIFQEVNIIDGKLNKVFIFLNKKIQITFNQSPGIVNTSDFENHPLNNRFEFKDRKLNIKNENGDVTNSIEWDEDALDAKATFLTDTEIILIEKQKDLPFLDRFYLINLGSDTKRLIITSATIIGRLDLKRGILVSKDRTKLLLKENNGPLVIGNIER